MNISRSLQCALPVPFQSSAARTLVKITFSMLRTLATLHAPFNVGKHSAGLSREDVGMRSLSRRRMASAFWLGMAACRRLRSTTSRDLSPPESPSLHLQPALRQTLQKRLSLSDLGHLGRPREAFERWREDGTRLV